MSTPKIATAIICEDVRIEENGKHIIIGVYPSDIVVPETPAHVTVVLWLQLDDVGTHGKNFEFRGLVSGKEVVRGGFTVSTSGGGERATIPLGKFPLIIEEEGDLRFDVRFADGGRWRNAIAMPVKVRPRSTA